MLPDLALVQLRNCQCVPDDFAQIAEDIRHLSETRHTNLFTATPLLAWGLLSPIDWLLEQVQPFFGCDLGPVVHWGLVAWAGLVLRTTAHRVACEPGAEVAALYFAKLADAEERFEISKIDGHQAGVVEKDRFPQVASTLVESAEGFATPPPWRPMWHPMGELGTSSGPLPSTQ